MNFFSRDLVLSIFSTNDSQEYKDRSKPLFMIYRKGNKVTVIEGVNTSALKVCAHIFLLADNLPF